MDVIIDDQLLADQMNGTVVGGVSLVHGVCGNAISFNGIDGYIDFGRHDGCLTNAGLCTNGITWSMWVYIRSTGLSYILTSGCGYLTWNTGFCLLVDSAGYLDYVVRDTSQRWKYISQHSAPLHQWVHLLATWYDEAGKMYVNGVLEADTAEVDYYSYSTNPPINFGRSTNNNFYSNVIIDEVLVWYDVKTIDFIEYIHQQGNF